MIEFATHEQGLHQVQLPMTRALLLAYLAYTTRHTRNGVRGAKPKAMHFPVVKSCKQHNLQLFSFHSLFTDSAECTLLALGGKRRATQRSAQSYSSDFYDKGIVFSTSY